MAFAGRTSLIYAPLVALGAALSGCSETAEPVIPTTAAVAAAPATPVVVATAASADPPSPSASILPTDDDGHTAGAPTDANPSVASAADASAPTAAEYTPPFPDRVDLFVPPKRQGGIVLKEGGSEDAVELLGFVRLDKQQVVLSVNGQLTRIAEGGSQYGIEVVSIQPPKVVLQRGRQRWQASLEN